MAAVPAPDAAGMPAWEAVPGPVMLLREDGALCASNAALREFLRLEAAERSGLAWERRLPEPARGSLHAALATRRDFRLEFDVDDGAGRRATVDCAAHWIEAGRHHVCLLHDITAARQAQAAAE